jgi:hypothetical protein
MPERLTFPRGYAGCNDRDLDCDEPALDGGVEGMGGQIARADERGQRTAPASDPFSAVK